MMTTLFVYGILQRGYWNHDRFCRGALGVQEAVVRGRLYEMPSGIPVLQVPEEDILVHGTTDSLADVATQARFSGHPAWWLNQSKAQAYFQSQARGAGMSFIPKSTLSRLQVQIPPLSVQKKVVKMVTLARHEQFLLDRLSELRSRLVKAVCIKAIQEQER